MPLPTFASLADVPESFRGYATEEDGKVRLDLVEGADVVGIRQQVRTLLDEKKTLQTRYADIDPDEYKSLKANKGQQKDVDARLQAAAAKETELNDKLTKKDQQMRKTAKRIEVTTALAKAGANIALLEPLMMQMVDVDEVNDELHVVIRNADGGIRYKDGAGNRFTVGDMLDEMKTKPEYQPAFMTKVGAGGGATSGNGNSSGGVRMIDPNNKADVMASLDDIKSGKARIVGA